jgi:hypothetical protein
VKNNYTQVAASSVGKECREYTGGRGIRLLRLKFRHLIQEEQ